MVSPEKREEMRKAAAERRRRLIAVFPVFQKELEKLREAGGLKPYELRDVQSALDELPKILLRLRDEGSTGEFNLSRFTSSGSMIRMVEYICGTKKLNVFLRGHLSEMEAMLRMKGAEFPITLPILYKLYHGEYSATPQSPSMRAVPKNQNLWFPA